MHIAELAQGRKIDHLYRCSTMPPNRWYLFGAIEGDVYLRPDGTTEPFGFRLEGDKYRDDATWQECGHVRRNSDGSLILEALPVESIAPAAVVVEPAPAPAPRRSRAKEK